jgi:cell division protein FtsL
MTRMNVILFAALLLSSLYLVRVSYDSRRLFAELDRAQSEERALAIEFERLKACASRRRRATSWRCAARRRPSRST